MRRFVRDNGLSLFFLAIFLVTAVAQSLVGHLEYNEQQRAHDAETLSYARYVVSSDFGSDVLENWQSEWLQFWLFALATVWLIQRGSNESKSPEEAGLESDQKQRVGGYADARSPRWARVRGWRLHLYSNSFVIVMGLIFLATWISQSLTSWNAYNDEQLHHDEATVSWTEYLGTPDFWERSLQNWQSEFLAVGTMVVFTIYLRQRGSPESKPVGSPHAETGTSG